MDDDSFLPNDEVDKLKKEIDMLKKRQGIVTETQDNENIKSSMITLSRSINSLIRIFKEASEELKMDTHDAVLVTQKLDTLIDRLDKVQQQNEKIAKGIVAIADMVEDMQHSEPRQQSMPPPRQQFSSQFSAQPPSAQPMMHSEGMQPKQLPTYNMPKEEEKKKGFLNFK